MRRCFGQSLVFVGLLVALQLNEPDAICAADKTLIRITSDGHFKQRPCWSPDGKQVVFARHKANTIFLYLRDIQSGQEERLTSSTTPEFDAVFSPDGKELLFAFDKTSPGQGDIEIYRTALSDRKLVPVATSNGLSHEESPCWSPDGKQFAFTSTRHGNQELYVADLMGGEWLRLTDDPAIDAHPTWSPDGRTIAFTTERWGDLEIALINADGSNLRRLTTSKGMDDYPAWSPDGRFLAYTSKRDGNDEIYIQEPDGEARNTTNDPAIDNFPTWTADGRIGFVSNRDGGFEIYTLKPDGIGPKTSQAEPVPQGFERLAQVDEFVRWQRLPNGIRVFVDRTTKKGASQSVLVVYATPNGNTIEQTLGCKASAGLPFQFDIQHVAAQVRQWREMTGQDVILAVVEAPKLSWPAFRADHKSAGQTIRELVDALVAEFKADRVVLAGHSGGGSFQLGYVSTVEAIPSVVERIVMLDSNYSYSDEIHAEKLLNWLRGDHARTLIVLAYDDREIVLNGKKVIGPDGGTFRATGRMIRGLGRDLTLTEHEVGPFRQTQGLEGQIQFFVHPNPENKILHTAMVGEMNGLLHGLVLRSNHAAGWNQFGGPRAYTKWIPPQPIAEPSTRKVSRADVPARALSRIPPRPADAITGSQFQDLIAGLTRQEREAAIVKQISDGNVPDFLRKLATIRAEFIDAEGVTHSGEYDVMPDYLSVGSDSDFYRIPMTPQSGLAIAEAFGASLTTTRVSDDVWAVATLRLDPRPLVKDRDSAVTFYQHHQIVQEQLRGQTPGQLISGIKKDVVISNRLMEKPHRVAIYGWHYPNGRPIQPMYVGHVDWYVDYSHGVRLMSDRVVVDGVSMAVGDVLKHPTFHRLLSDEGPMDVGKIRTEAGW